MKILASRILPHTSAFVRPRPSPTLVAIFLIIVGFLRPGSGCPGGSRPTGAVRDGRLLCAGALGGVLPDARPGGVADSPGELERTVGASCETSTGSLVGALPRGVADSSPEMESTVSGRVGAKIQHHVRFQRGGVALGRPRSPRRNANSRVLEFPAPAAFFSEGRSSPLTKAINHGPSTLFKAGRFHLAGSRGAISWQVNVEGALLQPRLACKISKYRHDGSQ